MERRGFLKTLAATVFADGASQLETNQLWYTKEYLVKFTGDSTKYVNDMRYSTCIQQL